ncbi:six-cysteine ranthipeptide SCIFF [bacterium]|nr:six-cysteine ranthipeptide SCIFF [bacterium]
MKKLTLLIKGTITEQKANQNCRECQTPCKSACKTSCTIGNQTCDQKKKKSRWIW